MQNSLLKKSYDNKEEFIKDFIKFCRWGKTECGGFGTYFINKFVGIQDEMWQFKFYLTRNTVETEAQLFLFDYSKDPAQDISITYPKTLWGDKYSRWDTELRNFLSREVLKCSKEERIQNR